MDRDTRTLVALAALLALALVWLAGIMTCLVWASQPGQAGAIVLAGLVFFLGLGFAHEARDELSEWVG